MIFLALTSCKTETISNNSSIDNALFGVVFFFRQSNF